MVDNKAAPASDPAEAKAPEGVAKLELSGQERRQRQSQIDRMRDIFAAQKKVRVRLAEDARVQINGYTFLIKGRETVEVPESVATVLEESGLY